MVPEEPPYTSPNSLGAVPETIREWVVFVVGLCAIGVLTSLVIVERTGTSPSAGGSSTRSSIPARTQPATTAPPSPTQPVSTPETTATTPAPGRRPEVRLVVNAARGDSWLMVRSLSASGRLLYEGVLTQGSVRRFAGRKLWVRIGASSNLDARLNGQPLRLLAGTFTALVTPSGLGPAG